MQSARLVSQGSIFPPWKEDSSLAEPGIWWIQSDLFVLREEMQEEFTSPDFSSQYPERRSQWTSLTPLESCTVAVGSLGAYTWEILGFYQLCLLVWFSLNPGFLKSEAAMFTSSVLTGPLRHANTEKEPLTMSHSHQQEKV